MQIDFGAVSGFAEVYLDGEYLGKHYGGITRGVEITEFTDPFIDFYKICP